MESDLTVPNLVLEGSDLGDLEDFCQRHGNRITMRRRLGLCIDTALGVEALHLAGILHGDIKPRNILVFTNENRGFIAKIADFGSSIPLHQSTFPRNACPGTRIFYAPELLDSLEGYSRDGLLKAEVYTLGFVFAFLLRGPHTFHKLRSASPRDIERLKKRGELANWILQDEELLLLERMIRPTFGSDAAEQERQRGIWRWAETQQYNNMQALRRKGQLPSFGNTVDDGDWITLANARLKNEKSEMLFSEMVNQIMSVEPNERPLDVHYILRVLRQILTLELYAVYDPNHQCAKLYEEQLASSRRRFNPEGFHEGLIGLPNPIAQGHAVDLIFFAIFDSYGDLGVLSSFRRKLRGSVGPPTGGWEYNESRNGLSRAPGLSKFLLKSVDIKSRVQKFMAWQANKVKEYVILVLEKRSRHHQKSREEKWTDKDEVFQKIPRIGDVEEGTPLLWSVWVGNLIAIQELLRHGADIFSYRQLDVLDMLDDALVYSSPLEAAITTYRYNILNLLLSSCTNPEKLRRGLNNLRLVGQSVRATPLLMGLERQILVQLRPTLLHGPLRHYAQLRTVETLLHYGSDPLRLSQEKLGQSVYAIELVCQDGNLLLLEFLWNYDEGKLRPSSTEYFKCLCDTIQTSKRDLFDFLLSHQHDIPLIAGTHELELDLLGKACMLSPDLHYVSSIANLIVQGLPLTPSAASTRPDFTNQLYIALLAGNTGAARLLCEHANGSFAGWFDNLSMQLPQSSRTDERHSKLTALQFAFGKQETVHGTTMIPAAANTRILPNLLRAFNEPEFLNSQVDPRSPNFPGDTALHMAAREGCLKEMDILLNGQNGGSFKLDVVNIHNETAVDVCIKHHETLVNELEDRLMQLGSSSTEGPLLRKIREVGAAISSLLGERKGSISAFCLLAIGESENSFLFTRRPNILMRVPYKPGKSHSHFSTLNSHCGYTAKTPWVDRTVGKYLLSANEHEDVVQVLRLAV
ncbi:hypothetical protein BJX76DRAFT_359394 [Aspergillus varians]